MGIAVERFPRTYWELDGIIFNRFGADDPDGNLLRVVETSKGWEGRPAPKSERGKRNLQQGSRPGASYLDERIISWQGYSISYSSALISREMLRLRGMCADPWATYELKRWEPDLGAMVCNVQIDDAFEVERRFTYNQHELLWSGQFVAPDPRMYEAEWQTYTAPMSGNAVGGVSVGTVGVSANSPGVNAGTYTSDSIVTIQNKGTAETGIVAELVGPWSNATITEIETGKTLNIADTFYDDNTLYINTDIDQQYGIPGHQGLRDFITSRRNRMTVNGGWFSVPPGKTRSYIWRSDTYSASARMNIRYRSAWR